jgi:hypothetical protein
MAEHNGNSFDLGRMWGRIETHIERQTDILLNISEKLDDLPFRLSTVIATAPDQKHNHIAEIIKAFVPILTIIGLMTGKLAWSDIPGLLGQ